jgi:hypothetical protein
VRIEAGGDSTVVQGNLIGLDASGAQSLTAGGSGIEVIDVDGTLIGGTSAAARNVIAGLHRGISVDGTSVNTVIQGNYVGTDVTGTSAIRISAHGIVLRSPSSLTTVGGPLAGEGNLISGTGDPGIRITANENIVRGNVLGLDVTGIQALPFDYEGIYLDSGASDNLIGGAAPGEGNTVTNAGTQGISLAGGAATSRNTISGNIVFDNPIGIDLGYDGVTLNDADDADTGPNGLLNFPDLAVAYTGSTVGAVQGSYGGAAGSALTLGLHGRGRARHGGGRRRAERLLHRQRRGQRPELRPAGFPVVLRRAPERYHVQLLTSAGHTGHRNRDRDADRRGHDRFGDPARSCGAVGRRRADVDASHTRRLDRGTGNRDGESSPPASYRGRHARSGWHRSLSGGMQ